MFLRFGCASLALALFTQVAATPADAQTERRTYQKAQRFQKSPQKSPKRVAEQPKPLSAEGPLLMLISLNQQRMFVYDANGFVVTSRVSTGMAGFDTPKGIYSILEKKAEHSSNIYEGASMPHMQRLLMTGIAMHGGIVPGYPASHGCIRLPFDFARKFFDLTSLNQRVVVVPDVHAPVGFEHPFLFTGLPSMVRAETTGEKAFKVGVDVAETLIGVTSAQAATEPAGRTIESAAEARVSKRNDLVGAIAAAGDRRVAAQDAEKTASQAIADAKTAAKAARGKANDLDRVASKAKSAQQAQERTLRTILARILKDTSKVRADQLEALRAQEATERERISPVTDEANAAIAAAKAANDAAKDAEKAVVAALNGLKAAKAEIKDAATAEIAAKDAVEAFDRQQANLDLPVSVFVSSKTGMVSVRQGFEKVFEVQAQIDNPDVPLDTFIFTALGWKDGTKTALNWSATEVNEYSTSYSSLDEDDTRKLRKSAPEQVKQPPQTEAEKAARTLDRITLPRDAEERIAEVIKPGSTLIVSSYDMARSETRYRGTDFVVQMPEVVAKISRPKPKRPLETVEYDGGGFFFFGPPPSSSSSTKKQKKPMRAQGSKGGLFW
jgi:hypothetical protein